MQKYSSSTRVITEAVLDLYDRIVDERLLVRRVNITANRLKSETEVREEEVFQQLDLFTDYDALKQQQEEEKKALAKERNVQEAMLDIKKKYGKNAILKGMNLQEGATAREKNSRIGGHKA